MSSTLRFGAMDRPRMSRTTLMVVLAGLACLAAFVLGWYRADRDTNAPYAGESAREIDLKDVHPPVAAASTVARAPSSSPDASTVPWPLWEFQLALPIPERDPPRTPLPWRMIGAGQSGGKWQLIVLRQGKVEPEYFSVGDKLPGGYRIDAISDEDVTLRQGRKTLILSYIGTQ